MMAMLVKGIPPPAGDMPGGRTVRGIGLRHRLNDDRRHRPAVRRRLGTVVAFSASLNTTWHLSQYEKHEKTCVRTNRPFLPVLIRVAASYGLARKLPRPHIRRWQYIAEQWAGQHAQLRQAASRV